MKKHRFSLRRSLAVFLALILSLSALAGCVTAEIPKDTEKSDTSEYISGTTAAQKDSPAFNYSDVPPFHGSPYYVLNGNKPYFTEDEISNLSYEYYSELDSLGRCGVTHASISKSTMPTEDRGDISDVHPTGWVQAFYNGQALYNRCHLIGFQLTGENDNEKNLVTGTRYMNATGMLPFENMVADYIKETGNHVMYRVTPYFEGNELVCRGVVMEAYSVEDEGDEISFCVFCYNVQPGITVDYATGNNREEEKETSEQAECDYILNTGSKKFHKPDCSSVKDMSEKNKKQYSGSREALVSEGYTPCGSCKP